MRCDVIIPVGPGHEVVYQQAVESVRIASQWSGPFTDVKIKVIDDTKGELGRSKARNIAIENSDADWIFFLDADDRIHPKAFDAVKPYIQEYDAIWGNIWEYTNGVAVWRYQVPEIDSYDRLLSYDPYLTLQMGHFIKRDKFLPFNEEMDCGEDWDYYLRIWKSSRCIKINDCLFLNQRGIHSTGPRSATGSEWTEIVSKIVGKERHILLDGQIEYRDGYWFPKSDRHFTKEVFELSHIQVCLKYCKKFDRAIDVGAHVGGWSKELSKYFNHIWSYEPESTNYKCLKKNLEELENVSYFNLALGDNLRKGSIITDNYTNSGTGYISDGDDINITTLDKHLGDMLIDFIKIDVEGFEYHVLIGAKEIIKKSKPAILIEMIQQADGRYGKPFDAAGKLLEEWGYRQVERLNKNYLYVVE